MFFTSSLKFLSSACLPVYLQLNVIILVRVCLSQVSCLLLHFLRHYMPLLLPSLLTDCCFCTFYDCQDYHLCYSILFSCHFSLLACLLGNCFCAPWYFESALFLKPIFLRLLSLSLPHFDCLFAVLLSTSFRLLLLTPCNIISHVVTA